MILHIGRSVIGSRPLHGGVDRNRETVTALDELRGRLLHGGVDRNLHCHLTRWHGGCRPLHGGVDRNIVLDAPFATSSVAPFTGAYNLAAMSPPSRGRGSKLGGPDKRGNDLCRLLHGGVDRNSMSRRSKDKRAKVASFTGAWIETQLKCCLNVLTNVASFTGAWIETRLPRARMVSGRVASFTGAWIETAHSPHRQRLAMVASFTGAWIETLTNCPSSRRHVVASFTGAWIETPSTRAIRPRPTVASFTGAWIETSTCRLTAIAKGRRLLHGGVDRNIWDNGKVNARQVASFTGAWIETKTRPSNAAIMRSTSNFACTSLTSLMGTIMLAAWRHILVSHITKASAKFGHERRFYQTPRLNTLSGNEMNQQVRWFSLRAI